MIGAHQFSVIDNSFPWVNEILQNEDPIPESPGIEATETDLSRLQAGWDDDSLVYGPHEGGELSVGAVREAIIERDAGSLVVGDRVYDRRMDLFGTIEKIVAPVSGGLARSGSIATVKYEYPFSSDSRPREVRLGKLIAAHRAERRG